jgi:4-amino-4-deoxy-L-arabinose transferase-like glycosyltransferase
MWRTFMARQNRFWLIVPALLLGLLLRIWFLVYFPHVVGDALVYGDLAKNWLLHGIYGLSDASGVTPTLIRLPGYPAYIALCFRLFGIENYFSIMVSQIVVDLAGCCVLALAVRRLYGDRAALLALWLSALCPFSAGYSVAVLAECLTLFCTAWAIYALVCWRDALALPATLRRAWLHLISLSLALVCALLLRPDNGLLAAAILPAVLWIAWKRSGMRRALAFAGVLCFIMVLPLVPWTIRNQQTFDVFQPLSPRMANDPGEFVTSGFNRWFRTWAVDYASTDEVYWAPQTDPIDLDSLPTRAYDSEQQESDTADLIIEYNKGPMVTPELDAKFNALAEERIRANPLRFYVELPVARLLNMWFRPRVEFLGIDLRWWEYSEHPTETWLAISYVTINLIYIVFAKVGWWRTRPHDAVLWALTAFVILRCLLLLTLDNSEPRYTLECFPVIFVLAGAAFRKKAPQQI